VVAAAIGGGDGFDLHRCRGVEHSVHDLPAYSFLTYVGSLAHEFNCGFLAVGLKPVTVRDPKATVADVPCRAAYCRRFDHHCPPRVSKSFSSNSRNIRRFTSRP